MAGIKEITSNPPIEYMADGTDMLDWSIRGAAGGVGKKYDKNKLKAREYAITDGLGNGSLDPSYSGNIVIEFFPQSIYDNAPSIPPGTPHTGAYQQWIGMVPGPLVRDDWAMDERTNHLYPPQFQNAQWVSTLQAGSYKLHCELCMVERGTFRDVYDRSENWGNYATVDLITSTGSTIIHRNVESRYYTPRSDVLWAGMGSAEAPAFFHEEIPFTLAEEATVGMITKLYWYYSDRHDLYFRFYIMDASVEAEPFDDGTYSGVTAWEPYRVTLPLKIISGGGGVYEHEFLLDEPLQAGSSISLASTGLTLPTYYGRNTLMIDSPVQPEVYIKFNELEPVPMWAEERPAQVSIYDLHEPQTGFDHNGIAILLPSEVTSEKEENGRWDLTLTHPIDQYGKWTYIIGQNVLKVNSQLYRIDSVETCIDSDSEYIQAHANHITYDMRDYWVEDAKFSVPDGENYLAQLSAHKKKDFPNQVPIVGEYIFDLTSDLSGAMSADIVDQSMIEAIFGADDSMASRYGGKVYRDNFHMSINKNLEGAPEGDAFAIRYGTDLTKLSFKIDFSEWITDLTCVDNVGALWGIWYGGDNYAIHHHKAKRVHFQYPDEKYDSEGMDRLIKDGEALWAQVSTPQISIVVSVAHLKGDPKYKDYINLQNFDVGYKGRVYVEHLGIDVEMEIVSIRRNELTGEAIQITLGNSRRSMIRSTVMSQTIVSPNSVEGKNAAATQAVQKELYNTQTALMGMSIAGMEAFKISDLERRTIAELEGGKT